MKREYYNLEFVKEQELKILLFFHEFCQSHNIQYSLSGGTLLGAVRHGGFIPWDDDVDVMMTRENYEKFCEAFLRGDFQDLFLQNYKTDGEYLNNFAKLLNTKIPAYIAETELLNIKRGLCIDIFPIDELPCNRLRNLLSRFQLSLLSVLKYSCLMHEEENATRRIFHAFISLIARFIGIQRLTQIASASWTPA